MKDKLYKLGDLRLEAGAPIKKDDWLVADPEGRAIPTQTWYGAFARALEDAETGDLFHVTSLLPGVSFHVKEK